MYPALYTYSTIYKLTPAILELNSSSKLIYIDFVKRIKREYESKRLSKGGVIPGGLSTRSDRFSSEMEKYFNEVFSEDNIEQINVYAHSLALTEFKHLFSFIPFSKGSIKASKDIAFKLEPIRQHPF